MPVGSSNTICIRERPILMSRPMVRATLADRKTVTRRTTGLDWLNKHPYYKDRVGKIELREGLWHFWDIQAGSSALPIFSVKCPYGTVGDILWVRESFLYRANKTAVVYRADLSDAEAAGVGAMYGGWKPSIHMPRRFCRIKLEITAVRIERLQDITHEDACAEGFDKQSSISSDKVIYGRTWGRLGFSQLWDELNSRGYSWESNPWVWAVSFRRAAL